MLCVMGGFYMKVKICLLTYFLSMFFCLNAFASDDINIANQILKLKKKIRINLKNVNYNKANGLQNNLSFKNEISDNNNQIKEESIINLKSRRSKFIKQKMKAKAKLNLRKQNTKAKRGRGRGRNNKVK